MSRDREDRPLPSSAVESCDVTSDNEDQPLIKQIQTTEYGKANGLSMVMTALFIAGEVAGSGVLALPGAVVNSGWIGLVLILAGCVASGYGGIRLGHCWSILQERYPEYQQGHTRDPYPAIGEKAVGRWMRYVVSLSIDFTLFGAAVVFLLIASQNIQSLLAQLNVHVSFCYWLLAVGGVLVPFTWLGTPKDFWPMAIAALLATAIACILILAGLSAPAQSLPPPTHKPPDVSSLFLAFGTIIFAFGGTPAFPTIQHDMKQPGKFWQSVILSYAAVFTMYVPVAATGYFLYGDSITTNVIQTMPHNALRILAEVLVTCHLLFAFVIVINPVSQEIEEILKVPLKFNWKRCVLRTLFMVAVVFVGEAIPHFGAILNLIGGSTTTFLTFVAPPIFYLRLTAMEGPWPDRKPALHHKVICLEILFVGVIGGVASTVAAIREIADPGTFVPPCFVNITAATGG